MNRQFKGLLLSIHFFWLSFFSTHLLYAQDLNVLEKDSQKIKLVIIGDSLTEGLGVDEKDSYPARLEILLRENGLNEAQVINGGVSGSTSATGMERLRWYLKAKPSHVMIALGANDGLRGLSPLETSKNLTQMIELALEKNVEVILMGMKMPANYGGKYRQEFEATYEQLAKKFPQVYYLSFILDGVALQKEFNQADGIHPNEKGHEIIAKNLWLKLKTLFKK
jgi:acyl-CoA thioesterase-1